MPYSHEFLTSLRCLFNAIHENKNLSIISEFTVLSYREKFGISVFFVGLFFYFTDQSNKKSTLKLLLPIDQTHNQCANDYCPSIKHKFKSTLKLLLPINQTQIQCSNEYCPSIKHKLKSRLKLLLPFGNQT